jgi:mRNA interferase MazF
MKKFREWLGLKEQVDSSTRRPSAKEGELWWASVGINIGREIDGKNSGFSRPVLVLKKLSSDLYLVAPATSRAHSGNWFIPFRHGDKISIACLQQIRVIDRKRLLRRIARVDTDDYHRVKLAIRTLYL